MKIRVMNLPRNVGEKELERLFWPYGKVAGGTLVLDAETGKSKGFGFVEMPQQEKALAAIAALHGSKLGKNTIRVKEAVEENAPDVKTGRQKFRETVRQKAYERAQEARQAAAERREKPAFKPVEFPWEQEPGRFSPKRVYKPKGKKSD